MCVLKSGLSSSSSIVKEKLPYFLLNCYLVDNFQQALTIFSPILDKFWRHTSKILENVIKKTWLPENPLRRLKRNWCRDLLIWLNLIRIYIFPWRLSSVNRWHFHKLFLADIFLYHIICVVYCKKKKKKKAWREIHNISF